MSALQAPTSQKVTTERTASLCPVPQQAKPASNMPFIGLVATLVALGMSGAIVLNTVIEQQARELQTMQRQATSLANQQAMLLDEVNLMRSPRVLALRAGQLGMVPNPNPVYVKLPSGDILGNPTPVTGTELPGLGGR